MRFAKTGAFAITLAGALMTAAGVAQADESITVTTALLGCAANAHIGTSELSTVSPGNSVTISDALAAELRQQGCLS